MSDTTADLHGGPEPLVQVVGLSTSFATECGVVRAVDGVDLTISRGRSLGIVGESGSGKTVLSRSIMGLLPSSAIRSGSVRYDGDELIGLSLGEMPRFWGREMAMVFQNPMVSLNPVMRIGDQIAEPLRLHLQMSRTDARDTALQLLHEVQIPEAAKRLRQYPHELSGGMRQRVVIAIALACGPAVLFADEPTTALDVTVQSQILDLIAERRRDRNMALVLVTHDLGVVAGHTDDIAVMYAGRIVERAPTTDLFANVKMPYTLALLRSIPRLDDEPHTRLHAISGRPPDLIDPPSGCGFAPRCAYAREKCHVEAPPLKPTEPSDHVYACWYPVGSAEFVEREEELAATGVHVRGSR